MAAMTSRLPLRLCTQRGNALVEFALVLPLLLLIFAGIVDFGFLFQRYEVITNAAREGARIGVLPGYDAADVEQRVLDYVQAGLFMSADDAATAVGTPDVQTVMLAAGTGAPFAATQVTVSFTYNYLIIGPIVNLVTGGGWAASITINSRSTMRREILGS